MEQQKTPITPMTQEEIRTQVAHALLEIGAVFLRPQQPFVWSSGIKSPIYCDNRLILSAPKQRILVETAIAQMVQREYPQAEILMGTSTAGIAHAAIAAHLMDMPMGYVRGGAKDHGRQNQIEGKLLPGQKTVVIEDLISTGGIVSIFTYRMKKGLDRLSQADVKNVSLTDFDCIIDVAAQTGYIKAEDLPRLRAFRDNPSDESWISNKHP